MTNASLICLLLSKMYMTVLCLDYNIVYSGDGRSAALLVLNASPPGLRAPAATPLIVPIVAYHDHRVPVTSGVEFYPVICKFHNFSSYL